MKSKHSNNLFHIGILGILLFSLSYFSNQYYLTENISCKNWDLQFKKESPVIGKIVILMNSLWGNKLTEASDTKDFSVRYQNRSLIIASPDGFDVLPNDFVVSVNGYPVDYKIKRWNGGTKYELLLGVIPLGDSILKVEYRGDDIEVKQGLNCTYLSAK